MNDAQSYNQFSTKKTNGSSAILDKYIKLIKWNPGGGDNIIDIGCGPGHTTKQILQPLLPPNVANLVGCDLTEEMVSFANAKYRDDVVKFIQLDIVNEIPEELCGVFDHLFSFYALHWVYDQRKVFSNLHRLIKPGGDMLLAFVAQQSLYEAYKQIAESNMWAEYMKGYDKLLSPYHKCKDVEDIEGTVNKLLQLANFNVNVLKVIDWSCTFTDLTDFKSFAKSINPCLRKIPADRVEEFTNDFTKFCITYNDVGEQQVVINTKVVVVYANK